MRNSTRTKADWERIVAENRRLVEEVNRLTIIERMVDEHYSTGTIHDDTWRKDPDAAHKVASINLKALSDLKHRVEFAEFCAREEASEKAKGASGQMNCFICGKPCGINSYCYVCTGCGKVWRIDDVLEEVARLRSDIMAYRLRLGYLVPGDCSGKLSNGEQPRNGIADAMQKSVADLVDIQLQDPATATDSYMRGLAAGLLTALATLTGTDQIHRLPPAPEKRRDEKPEREGGGQGSSATGLRADITSAINRHSAENGSNTPDFILAGFILQCLQAFDTAVNTRAGWYEKAPRKSEPAVPDNKKPVNPCTICKHHGIINKDVHSCDFLMSAPRWVRDRMKEYFIPSAYAPDGHDPNVVLSEVVGNERCPAFVPREVVDREWVNRPILNELTRS